MQYLPDGQTRRHQGQVSDRSLVYEQKRYGAHLPALLSTWSDGCWRDVLDRREGRGGGFKELQDPNDRRGAQRFASRVTWKCLQLSQLVLTVAA